MLYAISLNPVQLFFVVPDLAWKKTKTPEPEYKVPPHFSNDGKKKKSAYH